MSGWTIVLLNADRLAAVSAPFYARRWLTVFTTRLILALVVLYSALVAAPTFFIYGI